MPLSSLGLPALHAIPNLVHGFERRPREASSETREQARARVAHALAPFGRLHMLQQVHGSAVVQAPWEGTPAADASFAEGPGLLLGIETADCVPVLIVDPRRRAVAAAHAGWRGTAAGIAAVAAAALIARGSRPEDLVAALGPAIGVCCYEVGPELREAFGADAADAFRPGRGERLHLDLRRVNASQLARAGVPARAIHQLDACTACHPADYPSYRRDGKDCGRLVSYVGFRG